jgi:TRAP-type mannitol/chloroaromatic compound transport system permease small subunit
MAGSAAILEDDSLLSRLDRRLERFERVVALWGGIAVFTMMLLAVVSVSGRNAFNRPLPGYVDWIELLMPLIAFLGIAWTKRQGGHIRMDILVAVEFLTTLVALVLIGLLIWGAWAHFLRSFDWAAPLWSRDSSIDIGLPLWPAKLIVPMAFSLLALRMVLQMWGYGRAFIRNDSAPVAVPLTMSAAEQAAEEARHVSDLEG